MITVKNNTPELAPAFNKMIVELESDNIYKEKFQYLLDVLLYEFQFQTLQNGAVDFIEHSGYIQLIGTENGYNYKVGDAVLIFDTNSGKYTGIHRIRKAVTDNILILDTKFNGGDFINGNSYCFKINRNKLPKNPNGTALFNLHNFATNVIGCHFNLADFGFFNVPENFIDYSFLPNEEYYENITFTAISGFSDGTILTPSVRIEGNNYAPNVNDIVSISLDNSTTYNGLFTVLKVFSDNRFVISAKYTTGGLMSGKCIVLPKTTRAVNDINNIQPLKTIFNGSLTFLENLNFDWTKFDMSGANGDVKFLTTVPQLTKMRPNGKAYVQFYQSAINSVQGALISVLDKNGAVHDYELALSGNVSNEHIMAIGVGGEELNAVPMQDFKIVATRGLPIVRECDLIYTIHLIGTQGCVTSGEQWSQFVHPLSDNSYNGSGMLNDNWWVSNLFAKMVVKVEEYKVNGVDQITPQQMVYTQSYITAQQNEDKVIDYISSVTGLQVKNSTDVKAQYPFALSGEDFQIEFDFDNDIILRFTIEMQKVLDLKPIFYHVEINIDSLNCTRSYTVNGVEKSGFKGLPIPDNNVVKLSDKIEFKVAQPSCTDCNDFTRLIFQDKLGSMVGFEFELKRHKKINISSDGFEKEIYTTTPLPTDRGFTTIQSSYDEQFELNSNWVSQEEYDYLTEALTSPNMYLQIGTTVFPCIIIPKSMKLDRKKNDGLLRMKLNVKINGTNYTQRN